LELLSDFQITIPELGTIKAKHPPHVILTSNRSRELSDALRRRCFYHWIDYPSFEKEMRIVRRKLPRTEESLATQVVRLVQAVRELELTKPPGVAETLDCTEAATALGKSRLDVETVEQTLGCLVKSMEDATTIKAAGIANLIAQAN
jgi:MoxR-like ATPase